MSSGRRCCTWTPWMSSSPTPHPNCLQCINIQLILKISFIFSTRKRKLVMAMPVFQKEKPRHKENLWGSPELVNYTSLLLSVESPVYWDLIENHKREQEAGASRRGLPWTIVITLHCANQGHDWNLKTLNLCCHFTSKSAHKPHTQNKVTSEKVVVTTERLVSFAPICCPERRMFATKLRTTPLPNRADVIH